MLRVPLIFCQANRSVVRRRLQRVAFSTLYHHGAPFYDWFTTWLFLGEWQRWQDAAAALLPSRGLIVELGPGTGRCLGREAGPNRAWIGIDVSSSMLRIAARRQHPNAALIRADAQCLPLPAGCAAAIIATFPAPGIIGAAAAAEIGKILGVGGSVVLALGGVLRGDDWRRRLRRRALRLFYGTDRTSSRDNFALPGFVGRVTDLVTEHGIVAVYVGQPLVTGQPAPRP